MQRDQTGNSAISRASAPVERGQCSRRGAVPVPGVAFAFTRRWDYRTPWVSRAEELQEDTVELFGMTDVAPMGCASDHTLATSALVNNTAISAIGGGTEHLNASPREVESPMQRSAASLRHSRPWLRSSPETPMRIDEDDKLTLSMATTSVERPAQLRVLDGRLASGRSLLSPPRGLPPTQTPTPVHSRPLTGPPCPTD